MLPRSSLGPSPSARGPHARRPVALLRFPRRPFARSIGLAALVACSACSERGGPDALDALEHMALVPPGECRLVARFGAPTICENREGLLVGRYEVTRRELRDWLARRGASTAPELATRA